MKDNVVLFMPNVGGGGAERVMLTVARGMVDAGVKVHLILASAKGPYLADVPEGVELVDLKALRVLAALPSLVRELRRIRPHAALGTLPYANLVLLWAARIADPRIRVYLREANTPSQVLTGSSNLKDRAEMRLSKAFYRLAEGVVAVSDGVARDVQEYLGVPKEKITTIYNPVVTPDIPGLAAQAPEHPFFKSGSPVIVAMARLEPQKDISMLIRAFKRLKTTHSRARDARLLVLGEGRERQRLEQLIHELQLDDSVDLPGFVENPFSYISHANVFALSSRREGLPGSLIQALACGTTIVSTDCPSGPTEVLDGGRYGQLVRVGDTEAMANALARALREPANATQLRQRANVFSLDNGIRGYLNLLAPDKAPVLRKEDRVPGPIP